METKMKPKEIHRIWAEYRLQLVDVLYFVWCLAFYKYNRINYPPKGLFSVIFNKQIQVSILRVLDSPQQRLTYIFETLVNAVNEQLDSRQTTTPG